MRQRAELQLDNQPALPSAKQQALPPKSVKHLLHELEVHQIELEMQNEELRRTQTELDSSQARYFDFYDLAPVGYCSVSGEGLIKQANLTTATMLGVCRNDLLGQYFSQFIVSTDQDVFYLFRQRLLANQKTTDCELRLAQTNGTPFWVHLVAIAIAEGDGSFSLRLVLNDIAERKRAEEQQRLAASIFSHTREAIAVTDAQGTITEVNTAFTRITGYSRAEALGNTMHILYSGRQDTAFYASMWDELLGTGFWHGEIWNRRKDGEIYPELLDISVVPGAHGEGQSYVALFSDISPLKEHQRKFEHLAHLDALTGLPNRRLLEDRLNLTMAASKRSARYCALMYLDLDNFKPLNDTHGHGAGDLLLVEVAKRLSARVREVDTVARIGGDPWYTQRWHRAY
jgi:PAS domain S-box-containing protein